MEPENKNTAELILQNRNGFTDIENKYMFARGGRWGEGQIRNLGLADTQYCT